MKAILGVLFVSAVCLAVIGISLFYFHDVATMTASPETVAENFIRRVVTHRYGPALNNLDQVLRRRVDVDYLKRLSSDLNSQLGEILEVEGQPISMTSTDAEAEVAVKGLHSTVRTVRFALSLRRGEWVINRID
jgi:hypothetical protein